MKFKHIVAVLFILSPFAGMACMCGYGGTFTEVASKADAVIYAEVISVKANGKYTSIDVKIKEVFSGNLKKGKKIKIYGSDGANCLGTVKWHKKTEDLMLAIKESNGKYTLPGCGTYKLKVEYGMVQGLINRDFATATKKETDWPKWNKKEMDLDEFMALMKK